MPRKKKQRKCKKCGGSGSLQTTEITFGGRVVNYRLVNCARCNGLRRAKGEA
jgi:DnaJ-class molecular chaperone